MKKTSSKEALVFQRGPEKSGVEIERIADITGRIKVTKGCSPRNVTSNNANTSNKNTNQINHNSNNSNDLPKIIKMFHGFLSILIKTGGLSVLGL